MIKKEHFEKQIDQAKDILYELINLEFKYKVKNNHKENLRLLETFLDNNLSEYKNRFSQFFIYKNAVRSYLDTKVLLDRLLNNAIKDIIDMLMHVINQTNGGNSK